MSHATPSMSFMEGPSNCFSLAITVVDAAWDVGHFDAFIFIGPLLDNKEGNGNMPETLGGSLIVDHINGCHVVTVEQCRFLLFKS